MLRWDWRLRTEASTGLLLGLLLIPGVACDGDDRLLWDLRFEDDDDDDLGFGAVTSAAYNVKEYFYLPSLESLQTF
jgi:hypothetical protein